MANKIHLIKDDSLGGIEREYVEVDRKANVGDYIVYVNEFAGSRLKNGNIRKVGHSAFSNVVETEQGTEIYRHNYLALEPTDIVQIDGQRYQMVARHANVGEKVIVVETTRAPEVGTIGTCTRNDEFDDGSIDTDLSFVGSKDDGFINTEFTKYNVLEPIKPSTARTLTVDITANDEFIELIANLARRVSSLEQQLALTQGNVERQSEEIAAFQMDLTEVNENTKMLTEDIAMLDERTQSSPKEVDAVNFNGFIGMVADKVAEKLVRGGKYGA